MRLPSTLNPSSFLPRLPNAEQVILPLDFSSGWEPFFDQHKEIFPCRKIARLELRKENPNSVHHRFIILRMEDGSVHRFDRRPHPSSSPAQTMLGTPMESLDQCTANLNDASMENLNQSISEIELSLSGGINDILSVFAACYVISQDNDAQRYTLFKHNCFFYSWTILMVASRQRLPHRIPSYDSAVNRYLSGISKLISRQIDRDISFGTEAVLEALMIFRERFRYIVRPEVDGMMWKVLLSIPSSLVKAAGRGALGISSYLGTRQRIRKAMHDNIERKAKEIWQNGLERHNNAESLDVNLWLNNLHILMFPAVEQELRNILWENIAEIFASACESEETIQMVEELINRKRSLLWARQAWEFRAVCIAAFFGSISAVHTTLQQHPYDGHETHESVFNRLWVSASVGALSGAKKAAENSQEKVKDKEKWNRSWDPVWEDWDKAWEAALEPVRTTIVDSMIKASVRDYSQYGAKLLLDEMRENNLHALNAQVLKSVSGLRLLCVG